MALHPGAQPFSKKSKTNADTQNFPNQPIKKAKSAFLHRYAHVCCTVHIYSISGEKVGVGTLEFLGLGVMNFLRFLTSKM